MTEKNLQEREPLPKDALKTRYGKQFSEAPLYITANYAIGLVNSQ
jgi:hypothetical protein